MDGKLTTEALPSSPDLSENSSNPPSESGTSTNQKTTSLETPIPLGATPILSEIPNLDERLVAGEWLPAPKGAYLFKPGQSGNPAGRPKGSKSKVALLRLGVEQALREDASVHMQEILLTAVRKAKKGDNQMIKLLLELHMSKTNDLEDKATDEKITININQMPDVKTVIEGKLDKEVENE